MLIFCPIKDRLFYGENMDYGELMTLIKQLLGHKRAPRGAFRIRAGNETWSCAGQVIPFPKMKLKRCTKLPDNLIMDATPFLEKPGTLIDEIPAYEVYEVGDRVLIFEGLEAVQATVVNIGSTLITVIRDDGVRGGGQGGTWLADKATTRKLLPDKQTVPVASAELDALKKAVLKLGYKLDDAMLEVIPGMIETAKLPHEVIVTVQKPNLPDVKMESPHCKLSEVLEVAEILGSYAGIILVGPAGTGKSTLCEQVAQALEAPYYYTPQAMFKTDIVGCHTPYGYVSTPFREAFTKPLAVHAFEEFDSYSPQAGVAANVGLANGHMTFPDSPLPVPRGEKVVLFANMNTWGTGSDRVYVGRNQLDAATLNRFVFVEIDYDINVEAKLCQSQTAWLQLCWNVRKRAADLKIRKVVSTRQVVMGRMLLDGGMSTDKAERFVLREGLSDFDWNRLKEGSGM